VLTISLLLLACTAVGVTLAYIVDLPNPLKNTFNPTSVSCAVEGENPITIRNTGDVSAYIRAALVVNWQDDAGNVYWKSPVLGTDYELASGSNWTVGSDSFYYFTEPVAANSCTTAIVSKFIALTDAPTGYTLHIEVLASAVQSEPANAITDAWGITSFN